MKPIPTKIVEQVDTAAVLKSLRVTKPVTWACTYEQRKAVQLAAYRQGKRLRTKAVDGGFSFQLAGPVQKRPK